MSGMTALPEKINKYKAVLYPSWVLAMFLLLVIVKRAQHLIRMESAACRR